jgi:HEAT repeat protein
LPDELENTMTTRHVLITIGAVLAVISAVIMIVPASRRYTFGFARGEAYERGKYVSQWVQELQSEDTETRQVAAGTLGNLGAGARDSIPDLTNIMLEDSDPHVRSNAAFSIYRIVSDLRKHRESIPEVVPGLCQAIQDPEPWVRMNAAMALFSMGPEAGDAVPELIAAASRPENKRGIGSFTLTIREQMLAAFGTIGPEAKNAVPLLKAALDEDASNTRRVAARSLGQIGPAARDALEILKELAEDDPSDDVKNNAREAIQQIDPELAKKLAEQ